MLNYKECLLRSKLRLPRVKLKAYLLLAAFLLPTELSLANSIGTSHLACTQLLNKSLRDHVAYLSSDALEGRLTGSQGEHLATEYVAQIFTCLGLEPAGDNGTFFQEFDFTSSVSYGPSNSLTIIDQQGNNKKLTLNHEWRPLSFSDNGPVTAKELVFSGYGISAPAMGAFQAYDSYRHLDVKGKWVVVFRYTPEKIAAKYAHHLNRYASLRYKAFIAKEHGAQGIIFISGPNSQVRHQLIPLSTDASLAGSGIAALSIRDNVLDELLKNKSLKKVQDKLDSGQLDVPLNLKNIVITGQIGLTRCKKRGRNVLAKLRLNVKKVPMLLVGAHVDHLGYGELGSSRATAHEQKMIHYGADDNASGVASILNAAVVLSQMNHRKTLNNKQDILFAIWSGEELGLLGSSHFVRDFIKKSKNKSLRPDISAVINLDMVGRLQQQLILQGTASSTSWIPLIKRANKKQSLSLIVQKDPYLPTDSLSFYLHELPTLNLFTGSHDEYHSPSDRPETLNYQGMNTISQFLIHLIQELVQSTHLMKFHQVAKVQPNYRGGLKVYLGTIPDYASTDQIGVKLSGVSKNSPAEKAGVQSGDIILELAGKKIYDIYDYTFVLSTLHAGESKPLIVFRDQKKVTLTVLLQSRD